MAVYGTDLFPVVYLYFLWRNLIVTIMVIVAPVEPLFILNLSSVLVHVLDQSGGRPRVRARVCVAHVRERTKNPSSRWVISAPTKIERANRRSVGEEIILPGGYI